MSKSNRIGTILDRKTSSTHVNSRDDGCDGLYQMPLPLDRSSGVEAAWDIVLKMIRAEIDARGGLKTVAGDLDVAPSQLSHSLNERDGHNFYARWLIDLLMKSKTDDLSAFFAMLRGRKLAPQKELTPEQKLARLEEAMAAELGPGTRAAVLARAFGNEK